MYKKISINLGLACISGVLAFIFFNIWGYILKLNEMQMVSTEMNSENTIYFQTSMENIDFSKMYEELPENAVLKNDLSWEKSIVSIAFQDKVSSPPILEGRFFEKKDIESNLKCAVVGKNIELKETDSGKFVIINDIYYHVIGIMGCDYDTKLDGMTWVLMNKESINRYGTFSIDRVNTQEALDYLKNEDIWNKILILDHENVGILKVADRVTDFWLFPSIVAMTGCMFYLLLLQRWILGYKSEIKTRREVGFSKANILLLLLKRSSILYLSGVLIAAIFYSISARTLRIILPLIGEIIIFVLMWGIVLTFKEVHKIINTR